MKQAIKNRFWMLVWGVGMAAIWLCVAVLGLISPRRTMGFIEVITDYRVKWVRVEIDRDEQEGLRRFFEARLEKRGHKIG